MSIEYLKLSILYYLFSIIIVMAVYNNYYGTDIVLVCMWGEKLCQIFTNLVFPISVLNKCHLQSTLFLPFAAITSSLYLPTLLA